LVLLAASCKQDPQSANGPQTVLPLSNGGGTTPAHPAIAYMAIITSHSSSHPAICVMDSNGSHQTVLLTSGTSGHTFGSANDFFVSWSATGGSIAFVAATSNLSLYGDSIFALDVSLNSSGVPIASNVRLIYAAPASTDITHIEWCSTTTMGKIAFGTTKGTTSGSDRWVVSQSGGTPVKVAHLDSALTSKITWSPDDSRICFSWGVWDGSGTYTGGMLRIYSTTDNGSTWAYTDSVSLPASTYGTSTTGLEWSRGGTWTNGKLAFCRSGGVLTHSTLYYCDPVTGATPSTNNVTALYPSWNPTNTALAMTPSSGTSTDYIDKVTAFGTSVSTLATINCPWTYPKWRHTVWPN
jgi:hypothetical protein